MKKHRILCQKIFASKSSLNRHVKRIHQDHYTKTANFNSNCTEEVCTRDVGWGIQSGGGFGPFSKDISIKENEDKDSDTSNDSGTDSGTSNCSDTVSDTPMALTLFKIPSMALALI